MCTIGYLTGGLMLITPYLFYQDPYYCSNQTLQESCRKYVCSLPKEERIPFIPTAKVMYSLANHFGDYRCN